MGWLRGSSLTESKHDIDAPPTTRQSQAPLEPTHSSPITSTSNQAEDSDLNELMSLFQSGTAAQSQASTHEQNHGSQRPLESFRKWFSSAVPLKQTSYRAPSVTDNASRNNTSADSALARGQAHLPTELTADKNEEIHSNAPQKWIGDPPSTWNDDSVEDPTQPSPAYASLPVDMSCRTTLDYAIACQNLAGQWNAAYRYGTWGSCTEKWADFWFCMRIRTMTGEMRTDAIRRYYHEKEEAKYRGKPNSEDVWRPRRHLVKQGAFLTHAMPTSQFSSDEEWNMYEMAQRRAFREKLGLGPEQAGHVGTVRS